MTAKQQPTFIALFLLVAANILAAVSAQACTSSSIQDTNFRMAYHSVEQWSSGKVTYNRYCFRMSNVVAVTGASGCNPAKACCSSAPDLTIAKMTMNTAAKCTANAAKSKVKAAWWTFGAVKTRKSSKVTTAFRRAVGAVPARFEVKFRRLTVVQDSDHVCVNIPIDANNICPTITDLCGENECKFTITTTPLASQKNKACCVDGGLPLTCPDGQGTAADGTCQACPPGTYGKGLSPGQPCTPCAGYNEYTSAAGSSSCSVCDANRGATADHTGCGGCLDGFGGSEAGVCKLCPAGSYGKGLGITEPCVKCTGDLEFTAGPGWSKCGTCDPNRRTNPQHTSCNYCVDGYGGFKGTCMACGPGMYGKNLTDTQLCRVCSSTPQSYNDVWVATDCKTCPPDQQANTARTGCVAQPKVGCNGESSFPPSPCLTGTCGASSGASWVVCQADASTAWLSQSVKGYFNALAICKTLGYTTVSAYGANCGTVCGYCQSGQGKTCSDPGTRYFDNSGTGDVTNLGRYVNWECKK